MSRIRAKDTAPEVRLRKALWAVGLRFRKHFKGAPGSPDIAFIGPKVAVFCDGIFWHGRDWEKRKQRIVSNDSGYYVINPEEWEEKYGRDYVVGCDGTYIRW